MNGQTYLLLLASKLVSGTGQEFEAKAVKEAWRKPKAGTAFSSNYFLRAEKEGWIDPVLGSNGTYRVTAEGQQKIESLIKPAVVASSHSGGQLRIFEGRATHSFDKYVRSLFASAKKQVMIADAYVDEKIFDNLLDDVPPQVPISLIFEHPQGNFLSRLRRFEKQYTCEARIHPIHDRWVIIDGRGYVLGPSLKNAADAKPATVVELGTVDSQLLESFFVKIWSKSTKNLVAPIP